MPHERRALERALKDVESRLRGRPGAVALMFERCQILDRLGRADEARLGYVEILQRDPSHFGALNDLGLLLFKAGLRQEAFTCFNAAVAQHPNNPVAHANLALVLLRACEAALARKHYETAVSLDPRNTEARRGLALALRALGEEALAARYDDAFAAQPLVELPYRGAGTPVRVLLLVAAGAGNLPTDRFLDERTFAVTKCIAEYFDPARALPRHDLLFNAIGDADVCGKALQAAAAIAQRSAAPAINAPAAVAQTGRAANARRLKDIAGARVPHAALVSREALGAIELPYPLLLRSPGFHTGMHFERVENPGALASVAAGLPGDELLAIEFVDVRSADANVRKYRVMFVDGALYPLHLAIAPQWKVHYFSAAMADHPEHRREEEAFLIDVVGTLGPDAVATLERVEQSLGLDYAGIDFAIDAAGRVVIFEANATMIVPVPDPDPRWTYRRAPIERIESAVHEMLLSRAARPSP